MVVHRALWGAMGVISLALLFIPGLAAPFRLLKWGLWGIVITVMAIGYACSDPKGPQRFVPPNRRIFMIAGGFVMWSALAPFLSTPFITVHGAGILQMFMGFIFSWLVALELSDTDSKTRCNSLIVLCAGGSFLSVVVILQAAGLTFPGFTPADSTEFQAPGTLGNPNWTAAFLLPLVPMLLGVRCWLQEEGGSRLQRSACIGMAVLIAAATLATRSKAGAIALSAGIIAYILLDSGLHRRIRSCILIGLSATSAILLIWLVFSGSLTSLTWTRGRLFLWEACLVLIAKNPISGFGLGGFQPAYPQALPQLLKGDPQAFMPLHRIEFAYNDILQTAVDAGLPAALLLFALIFMLIRQAYQNKDGMSRGVGAAVAAMALYGCLDSPLQLPGTLALWWFLAGWMMAGTKQGSDTTASSSRHRKRHRAVFASFIVLLGMFQAVRFGVADLFWTRGVSALGANEYHHAAEDMRTAAAFAPENAKLLSESAKVFLLERNSAQALKTVDRALLSGFSFDDLFLRQRVIKRMRGKAMIVDEWRRMAHDYPGLFTPHIELARYYLSQNDLRSARIELEIVMLIRQTDDLDRTYKVEAKRMLENILKQASDR